MGESEDDVALGAPEAVDAEEGERELEPVDPERLPPAERDQYLFHRSGGNAVGAIALAGLCVLGMSDSLATRCGVGTPPQLWQNAILVVGWAVGWWVSARPNWRTPRWLVGGALVVAAACGAYWGFRAALGVGVVALFFGQMGMTAYGEYRGAIDLRAPDRNWRVLAHAGAIRAWGVGILVAFFSANICGAWFAWFG